MSRGPRAAPPLALSLVAMAACASHPGPTVLEPELVMSLDELDFGEAGVGSTVTSGLQVTNAGLAVLELVGAVEGSDAFGIDPAELELGAGEAGRLDVTFAPDTWPADFAAELVLSTNDRDQPTLAVALSGVGVPTPFPDIDLQPAAPIEIADVTPGTTGQAAFRVHNLGDAPLEITGTALETTQPGVFAAFIDLSPGLILQKDEFTTMVVDYSPTDSGGDSARVRISSDDPDEPVVEVVLLGNGG